jgi:hypothetical protein
MKGCKAGEAAVHSMGTTLRACTHLFLDAAPEQVQGVKHRHADLHEGQGKGCSCCRARCPTSVGAQSPCALQLGRTSGAHAALLGSATQLQAGQPYARFGCHGLHAHVLLRYLMPGRRDRGRARGLLQARVEVRLKPDSE